MNSIPFFGLFFNVYRTLVCILFKILVCVNLHIGARQRKFTEGFARLEIPFDLSNPIHRKVFDALSDYANNGYSTQSAMVIDAVSKMIDGEYAPENIAEKIANCFSAKRIVFTEDNDLIDYDPGQDNGSYFDVALSFIDGLDKMI